MKIVVISPEADDLREMAVMGGLFAAGLQRYHVRTPGLSSDQLEAWLRGLPNEWRPRLVLHQHHQLVAELGLGGRHWRDDGSANAFPAGGTPALPASRSCHDLATLRGALGRYDSVFFGPVFSSLSKPGYGPGASFVPQELSSLLEGRTASERRTSVLALGGITAETAPRALAMGFDGVAVLGALWQSHDPVGAFENITRHFPRPAENALGFRGAETPLMCLTQDGLAGSHAEQAARLCGAGAKWIQLRMKGATPDAWLATAREVVAICRRHDATCIVNDSVDVALAAGADGVHLGRLDLEWREARRQLGPSRLLGGTVNNADDVARTRAADCLDYVGVGPLRFTATKQKLAPVLGLAGVRSLIAQLGDLPAWVIGGVGADDLPGLRSAGAAGVAVAGELYRGGLIEENYRALETAWSGPELPRATSDLRAGRAMTEATTLTG